MEIFNIGSIRGLGAASAVTVGMFDGVHAGHRHLLERLGGEASSRGLRPVVVTFRNHPRRVLRPGERFGLLSTFDERMAMLERCGVEHVAVVDFDDATAHLSACGFAERFLLGVLNMRMLVLGYDNMFGSRAADDFDRLPALGEREGFGICRADAVVVDGVEVSSTQIRKALAEGDMRKANAMLVEPYSLTGVVLHGRHVGTGLGFPTANVGVGDGEKLLPRDGVYAVNAVVDGCSYAAMANLGECPTFGVTGSQLEVHLIGYEGDLYDKRVTVRFLERLRGTRRFDTPEALVAQLADDCVAAKRICDNTLKG